MAEEEVDEEVGARSQTWKHQGQLDWMADNWGYDYDEMTPLEIVTVFAKHRVPWRKSDVYAELVETHRDEVDEAKAQRKAERAEAAAQRKVEKEAEAAAAAEKEAAKAKGASKATKATKATSKATKATGATKTAAKRTGGTRAGSKAKAGAGDPFG